MMSSQPQMSVDNLMKMIKGFVDMLILASGYQSSGCFVHWDSSNMKRAFQWALFFENVLRHLKRSDDYSNFKKDLNAAICDMTSDPSFPQALASLSSDTLVCARMLLSEHMAHALPLRAEHLRALVTATIELDLDEYKALEPNYFNVYLDKLMLLSSSSALNRKMRGLEQNSITSSVISGQDTIQENCSVGDHSKHVIQELSRRQCSASCLSVAETNLNIISESVSFTDLSKYQDDKDHATTMSQGQFVDFFVWSRWRSGNLSYFVDSRTVRLVSGAKMIFSTPKLQWSKVFKQLNLSSEDDSLETLEILLLGCISSQWDCTIQHFMSLSFDLVDISNQYHELCNLLCRRLLKRQIDPEVECSKVKDILEYAIEFFGSQQNLLWKLSPALVAAAIPPWSHLFRLYLNEIENQLKGECSAIRYCSCVKDGNEHTTCAVAERIWCLHIFHIARAST